MKTRFYPLTHSVVKVEEILTLLPAGHLQSLDISFGLFRELSEESHVRIMGNGGQLRSHQSVIQPSLISWSEFGTIG